MGLPGMFFVFFFNYCVVVTSYSTLTPLNPQLRPGGVLGVVPAVRLENSKLASLYLGCFCLSSTFTMGVFAASYGFCSHACARKANLEIQIHCISAASCILVGITWLLLLSIGKLDDVFP